jgi:hypothetical protein
MNRKPSRPFVYLALIMVFLLVIGLVVVGVLASSNRPLSPFDLTRQAIISQNIVGPANAIETGTFQAAERQTETAKAAFTPIHYDASMSPTALPYTELHSMTAVAQYTPTPAFSIYGDQENLSESAQTAVWILMTSGGPDDYATFFAEETLFASASQTVQSLTATRTPSSTALPTNTASGSGVVQCAFSWAHRDLPDVALLAQNALDGASIADTTIRADAYGEECINFSTNTVVSFGAMTTDFYVTAQVSNVNDTPALADYVKAVYAILSDLDQDSLPARLGYLDVTFTAGTTTKYLHTSFDDIKAALDRNLSGQRLLDALGGLR